MLSNPIQFVVLCLILIGVGHLIFARKIVLMKPIAISKMTTVTLRLNKQELSDPHLKTLQNVLGVNDKKTLVEALEKIGKAALLEYCEMIIGRGTADKLDELRQTRLFLLMEHYFIDRLPREDEVEKFFHLSSKSRGLLKTTIAKNRTSLTKLNSFLLVYVNSAKKNSDGSYYEFDCPSPTIIDELNSIIKQKWYSLEVVTKVFKSASSYKIHPDTYDKLKEFLNV